VAELSSEPTWAIVAARAADEKTTSPTVIIDVGPVLGIVGWFVITSGHNAPQIRALCDRVEEAITEAGGPKPVRIEGRDSGWVCLDYGDFIVHVFHDEQRSVYDLERLYDDMERVEWS
jgi:ribosome-associated protein